MTNNLETNKEIALNLSRAIMNGEWDKADALLADDFQYIGDGKPAINKQQYLYFMKEMLCTAMTEMDMKFIRVIGDDSSRLHQRNDQFRCIFWNSCNK